VTDRYLPCSLPAYAGRILSFRCESVNYFKNIVHIKIKVGDF
jgi:hypothetical protein